MRVIKRPFAYELVIERKQSSGIRKILSLMYMNLKSRRTKSFPESFEAAFF